MEEPLEALPVDGEVVLLGTCPGGTALTPEAALQTCKRVHDAAEEALRQKASGPSSSNE
jgi:hypothetical protein